MSTIQPPNQPNTSLTPDPIQNGDDSWFLQPKQRAAAVSPSTSPVQGEHTQTGPSEPVAAHGFTLYLPNQQPAEQHSRRQPHTPSHQTNADAAARIIRGKISKLYRDEPPAKQELQAIANQTHPASKHQQFIATLSSSGKPMAQIQTEWHAYYSSLPDQEKYAVWQEFYSNYEQATRFAQSMMERNNTQQDTPSTHHTPTTHQHHHAPQRPQQHAPRSHHPTRQEKSQTIQAFREQLQAKFPIAGKLSRAAHFRSIAFGLGMGGIFVVLVLFSFFNERFILPFVMPSSTVTNTRLIIDPNQNADVGPESLIIIPKINVEVPVVFGANTIEEKDIQDALKNGVVHYPTTEVPGQLGNVAIVGHSSNNILNTGKFKFAFLMLNKLEVEDTFYVHYGGVRYVYKVYELKIVEPTDVGVLEDTDRPASITLITCDPPGTNLRRLIIHAEQISPDPSANTASTAPTAPEQPAIVPGNAPSLFQRLTDAIF